MQKLHHLFGISTTKVSAFALEALYGLYYRLGHGIMGLGRPALQVKLLTLGNTLVAIFVVQANAQQIDWFATFGRLGSNVDMLQAVIFAVFAHTAFLLR